MGRNTTGLKRGGSPGRKKGVPNKAKREIQRFATEQLEDTAYVRDLKVRLRRGKAPHVETLLYHYAYGKPRETLALENVPPFLLRIDDGDQD